MKIFVSSECIKFGIAKNAQSCPVALAIDEQYESTGNYAVSITNSHLAIFTGVRRTRLTMLPPKVQYFIQKFDQGKPVRPIEFEMKDIPELELKEKE